VLLEAISPALGRTGWSSRLHSCRTQPPGPPARDGMWCQSEHNNARPGSASVRTGRIGGSRGLTQADLTRYCSPRGGVVKIAAAYPSTHSHRDAVRDGVPSASSHSRFRRQCAHRGGYRGHGATDSVPDLRGPRTRNRTGVLSSMRSGRRCYGTVLTIPNRRCRSCLVLDGAEQFTSRKKRPRDSNIRRARGRASTDRLTHISPRCLWEHRRRWASWRRHRSSHTAPFLSLPPLLD